MSYIFEVSSENNNLDEVQDYINFGGLPDGEFVGFHHYTVQGHTVDRVQFYDQKYALLFKLKFNVKVITWDESDNQDIVTKEELLARGYEHMAIRILSDKSVEFEQWCQDHEIAVVEEMKFVGATVPYNIYTPKGYAALVKLTWGGSV